MQKTAQKRSVLNKLRETTNISGIAAEKFFNPEFERVMNSLREADNKIRSVASGTDIEGEDAGIDPVSLKELLKNAKSNLNKREYMTSVAFLGRFHKKVESIVKFIQQLNFDVDQVHNDFLFKDLDEDQRKHLHEMKSKFAGRQAVALVSEASIKDFLSNVFTERGRALGAWEKRYPKQVGKIKKDSANLLSKSEGLLAAILSALKEMSSARATRKVDDYMKAANKIVGHYSNYDKTFRDYYATNIKGFLEKQELIAPTKKVEDSSELGKQDVAVETAPSDKPEAVEEMPTSVDVPMSSSVPPIPLVVKKEPASVPPAPNSIEDIYNAINTPGGISHPMIPTMPSPPTRDTIPSPPPGLEDGPDTVKEKHPEILPPNAAHARFMESLKTLGNESPEFLAAHISRYAKSIISADPGTAIQLFNIVKSIKKAG